MDEKSKGSLSLLVIGSGLLLLVPCVAVLLLMPVAACPYCLGEGLVEDPPPSGRWVREADLVHRMCDCCGDRFKVGRFKIWRFEWGTIPQPPVYRKSSTKDFLEIRGVRLQKITDAAMAKTGWAEPPVTESDRPDLIPVLLGALQDEDGEIRKQAALTLAHMSRKELLPGLLAELKRNPSVAEYLAPGIRWLTRFHDLRPAAVEGLREIVEAKPAASLNSRFHAAVALMELQEPCNSDVFIERVKSWRLGEEMAVKGVLRYDRKDAIQAFIHELAKRPPTYMDNLVEALSKLTGENFGKDPAAWFRWFEKNKDRFPPQIE